MKTIFTLFIILFFGTMCACQQENIVDDENKTIDLDEKSAELIEADNAFGFEIFQKIRQTNDDENIMISPLSISVAFAITYNNADKNTKTEMEKAMKLNGLIAEQINNSYKMLINALQSLDKDVVFEIANAIFYADGFSVKPDFLNINKAIYNAEVEKLNFGSPSTIQTINS